MRTRRIEKAVEILIASRVIRHDHSGNLEIADDFKTVADIALWCKDKDAFFANRRGMSKPDYIAHMANVKAVADAYDTWCEEDCPCRGLSSNGKRCRNGVDWRQWSEDCVMAGTGDGSVYLDEELLFLRFDPETTPYCKYHRPQAIKLRSFKKDIAAKSVQAILHRLSEAS